MIIQKGKEKNERTDFDFDCFRKKIKRNPNLGG